ncbi:mitochondrial 37s ribosomal protein mrps16 [Ophiostoma piceae UAMH 11346]|uniref:Mitochondrial 37s ribosomal protein mrps16 n=1 Tax=Ophiostoma piceae (strain UAMH 11346) TaxID=1262450 RepID=S3D4U2_OPHP1|nr:mitochondrial 37s ribosomal protein mrps16 [Ophiostoma piceae UAMH 11346]
MVVKIRLARFGRKNSPFYNIVVTQARTARNSRPMEVLGTYDPHPKLDAYAAATNATSAAAAGALSSKSGKIEWPTPELVKAAKAAEPTDAHLDAQAAPVQSTAHKDIQLDITRTKYWIGVGAQPTDPVWRILSLVGILEPKGAAAAAKLQAAQ